VARPQRAQADLSARRGRADGVRGRGLRRDPATLTDALRAEIDQITAAREARIATVKHLHEAPIARLWHMGKLQRAFELQAASTGDPAAATALLLGGLAYRPPFLADWQAATECCHCRRWRAVGRAPLAVVSR
jgi:hypothetical protein